jgi:PIN domain nuclease of toxin-antitoxin system
VTLLLDTPTILWFWWASPELSPGATATLCVPSNRKLVSLASAWEVAIKVSLGKLDIGGSYQGFFQQQMLLNNFEWLPITTNHLEVVSNLPFHHRDPFDRLLIAQALTEGTLIIGADAVFDLYGVTRLW